MVVVLKWWEIIVYLIGFGGLTTLFLFLLNWKRFAPLDTQDVNIKSATVEKIKAETEETKSKAEVSVADAALRWAERLTMECNKTKEQLDKAEKDLDIALDSLRDTTIKMSEVQHDLKNERQQNTLMKYQIEQLKLEIEKLKKSK